LPDVSDTVLIGQFFYLTEFIKMAKHRANINIHSLAAEYFAAYNPLTYMLGPNKYVPRHRDPNSVKPMVHKTMLYNRSIQTLPINKSELMIK